MKKILVLGATGMLGHMVLRVLLQVKEWQVVGVSSKEFDAAKEVRIPDDYDYIINCIGALAGSDAATLQRVNAEFPHRLAKATTAKVIHMSTDGVFSGKGGPYNEDSPTDAIDAYGKSKRDGEVQAPNVINIRTSIIGPSPYKKKGLLEWFLSQPDGATVPGYTNHIWNGVTTLQFAELCKRIIENDAFDALRKESSVFHFAPNEPVTKYELLKRFSEVYGKPIKVESVKNPQGAIMRVLKTNYGGFKKLFPHGIKMEDALHEQLTYL